MKLAFIIIELALVIGLAVTMRHGISNHAAILEWVVAAIFSFYIFSFAADLWPAVRTKPRDMRFRKADLAATPVVSGSPPDSDISTNEFDLTEQGLGVRPGAPHSIAPLPERNTMPTGA